MKDITLDQFMIKPEQFIQSAAFGDHAKINLGDGHAAIVIDETEWTMLTQALKICVEHPEWTAR